MSEILNNTVTAPLPPLFIILFHLIRSVSNWASSYLQLVIKLAVVTGAVKLLTRDGGLGIVK